MPKLGYAGALDDGRGRARVSLFRHKHEIESGRTSSVGMEVRLYVLSIRIATLHLSFYPSNFLSF